MKTWMKDAIAILLLTLFFVAIMTYRQYCITPDIDDAYSEIYGLEQEGAEW